MFITLEQLQNSEDFKVCVDFCEVIPDINPSKEVKAILEAELKGACIEVKGSVEAVVEVECDRCLEKFSHKLEIQIKEVFTTAAAFDYSHNEIELKNDNFVVELDNEGQIDVVDLIYQSIILNLPSKKICSENCEGSEVLQKLTANRIDPRLAVFQDITKNLSKKEGK
ncbi:MAG: DUF177 domain-containing protein [Candidatus Gastranaerophilales bacterium]|nr:DUF177 domain-containing protein [Candidatus Gastranaerophilales bacterium]